MTDARRLGFAPAKVNLALHVLGRRPDGFHDLESLIAFADVGDCLALYDSDAERLEVAGPFAAALTGSCREIDNLVMRAAAAFRAAFGGRVRHVRLEKRLPVAAGIGGGSADAAAVLRLLAAEAGLAHDDARVVALARELGSDVPACLVRRPCLVTGTGDTVVPLTGFAAVPVVVVNAGTAVATAQVFRRWSDHNAQSVPRPLDPGAVEAARDAPELARALTGSQNMLQPAAVAIAPEIGRVLARLEAAVGCVLARMSGSGGSCFGLFAERAQATAAAQQIGAANPGWWVAATQFLGARERPPQT